MKQRRSKFHFKSMSNAIAAVTLALTFVSGSAGAEPEKMDVGTHRFLIEKLESVVALTPKGDSTRVPAILRLADLYSEEARLLSMIEIEKGCFQNPKEKGCDSSNADRQSAIMFYEMALQESSGASQSRILFQLAHLYEASGATGKAAQLYRKILSLGPKHFSKIVLGQSQAGLGELHFKNKLFKEAKKAFELALENPSTPRRGWVQYRIAWSELNLNQAELGKRRLISILKTPALLTFDSTDGAKQDNSFQEDVARDLTMFLVRTGFNESDIELLWQLSPVDARKSILMELAEEAERLGQKRAAIAVWSTLASRGTLEGRERIEAQARVATLRFGLGEKTKAVSDFKLAMDLWKKSGCAPEADCSVLQKRFRKLVIDWNKNEETKLTVELLAMYRLYADQFQNDSEMAYWGANVARELKANRDASILYHLAAESAAKSISSESSESKESQQIRTVFEGSLLAEIEMAELTKDAKLRDQAYSHYLKLNAQGPKALEVRYQQAHMVYDAENFVKAADMFFQLAARDERCREKSASQLCRQAADLALDAIVILKNDERLEATALEFANIYSANNQSGSNKDFATIARRARLNIAAKAAASGSPSAMTENLKKLTELNLRDASHTEVLLTHQNRFVLAEKTRNFSAASAAAVSIINFKGATAAEREDAMAKRLWVAEMQLDFSTAYITARQMEMKTIKPADRELKLALLAELSGRDARSHLIKFISLTNDRKAELAARIKLIKAANFSVHEFDRHFKVLSRDVDVLANVGLDVYAHISSQKNAQRFAKRLLAVRGLAKRAEGAVMLRSGNMNSIGTWVKSLSLQTLPSSVGDRTLQRALALRIKNLDNADKFANRQIKSDDAWTQAIVLQALAIENRRLKNEILALPLPKGISEKDARRYQTLIARQVAPFEIKAIKIDQKISKFWTSNSVASLATAIEQSTGSKRTLLVREARSLMTVLAMLASAPGPVKAEKRLALAIEMPVPEVRPASLTAAREDVLKNPFDLHTLKRLRTLEAEAGRDTMVAYLDSRMNRIGARP